MSLRISFPEGLSVAEWEDKGFVMVTISAPTRTTSIMFYSQRRVIDEINGCLLASGDWEEPNAVVLEPFTRESVDAFLLRAEQSGYARFW
jgi:hypothetical protein